MSNTNTVPFKDLLGKARKSSLFSVALLLVVSVVAISIISPSFLSQSNLKTTSIGFSCNGIIAIAMTVALISGGFDLSVGAVMGLSAACLLQLSNSGLNVWVAAVLAVAISCIVGTFTGFLVGYVKLNPFITTLGMQQVCRGLVYVLTKGGSVPFSTVATAQDVSVFRSLGTGEVFGFPTLVIIFVVVAILAEIIVRKSSLMMRVFYVGSNEKAAILSGINAKAVKLFVYILTAGLAGVAGVLNSARFGIASSSTGNGVEMTVISAAVIGGASLAGGSGSVLGSVFGVILLSVLNNALVLFRVSLHWQSVISGIVLILAILLDLLNNRNKYKA